MSTTTRVRGWIYDPIFDYVETTNHTREDYLEHEEYKVYPNFLISTFNGLNRVWKHTIDKEVNIFDRCCELCPISEDSRKYLYASVRHIV